MGAVFSFLQQEGRAPADDLDAVINKVLQRLHQTHLARLAVDHGQKDHAEAFLQLGVLVELIQHNLRLRAALQLDDDAHAVAVALIADVADLLDDLLVHQFGDALDQPRLVHLVGNLGDDDGVAILVEVLAGHLGAHQEAAATVGVGVLDAAAAMNEAAGGEVRPLHELQHALERRLRVAYQLDGRVQNLSNIVRRDIGGHAHGDAVAAVHQESRNARGQNGGLGRAVVKVGDKVHRVLVNVGQQVAGNSRQAGFGVTVGRRRIAVHAAEVALSIHQRVAQAEVLRHAHQRVIHRAVAVGMILAQHFADHLGALDVLAVVQQTHVMHRVQNAAVHRFESVAHIGQSAANDDRHRIVEIRTLHLVFDVDGDHVLRRLVAAIERKLGVVEVVGHQES